MPGEAGPLLQAADWSEEDVQRWLCEEGLQELAAVFRANNMDGAELILLNKETVGELGIGESGIESRTSAQSTQRHTHALTHTRGIEDLPFDNRNTTKPELNRMT